MSSPTSGGADARTGLPPGVEVGRLGQRFAAYLIDVALAIVASMVLALVVPALSGAGRVVLSVVLVLIILGWAGYLVFRLGKFAATPGMAAMKLQVVGFYDGRPIGFSRAFVRGVILVLLSASVIGVIIMAIVLVLHPRYQGWHDLAVQSVLIKQRQLAPPASADRVSSPPADSTSPTPAVSPDPAPLSPPDGVAVGAIMAPDTPDSAPEPPPVPPAEAETREPPHDDSANVEAADAGPADAGPADDGPGDAKTQDDTRANADPASVEAGWSAVLDDGRQIAVEGLVLIGRNPQPQPGEEDAQLIKVADETRTVSKSHLAVGLDATGLFIVDRGSTNGSIVTTPAGTSTRCGAGDIVYAANGTIVSLGDHWLEIRRG